MIAEEDVLSRMLLMGAPYEVVGHANRSLTECFQATGYNSGNLLIGNGLVKQLSYDRLVPYSASMSPEYIDEHFDRVVIPAANFLFPGFDLSPLSDVLEKVKLPVFMVGLGAQLPSEGSELRNIPEGTWRLVRIASERSHSIGVRGYFTADQLVKNGVKNVSVTGCPSLYTSLAPSIRIARPDKVDGNVVFNGSRNVVGHSRDKEAAIRVERLLLNMAIDTRSPFVFQNEAPEMELSTGEDPVPHLETLKSLGKFFDRDPMELAAYYRDYGKLFFSVDQWFEWVSQFSLSIGTRFHGNMAALQSGVPAIVLVHDSRTKELCEFACIPHVMVGDVTELDLQKLYEAADFDVFEERYNSLYRKYFGFLRDNGIPNKLAFNFDLPARGRIVPSVSTQASA